jgi:hypothetical protein
MLGSVKQSMAQQESFLRGGFNFNDIGRLGVSTVINIVCYHPISALIDRLENRFQPVDESKRMPRKVLGFGALTLLLNMIQVKILLGARLSRVASLAVIVTLTALMILRYIYDKSQWRSSPLPVIEDSTVNPPRPNGDGLGVPLNPSLGSSERSLLLPPRTPESDDFPYEFLDDNASPAQPDDEPFNFLQFEDEFPTQPILTVNPPTPTLPTLPSSLNGGPGKPLGLSLLPTLQQPTASNILTDAQYNVLENALHCTRETLNHLFIGLEATKNKDRKGVVLKLLQERAPHITRLLSSPNLLPGRQNLEGTYLDDNMKKLFVYYIDEFKRLSTKKELIAIIPRYEHMIRNMMTRFPNQDQTRVMERVFQNNDGEMYAACHFADNCAYTSEELREFVQFFITNPTAEQTFIILGPLSQAGRIIQKHRDEPERTGFKTPSDPGLKKRVMNFFIFEFKKRIGERPEGTTGMTVLEFKMIFEEIVKDYDLLGSKSNRFIQAIQP